jgi:hypothetical protein
MNTLYETPLKYKMSIGLTTVERKYTLRFCDDNTLVYCFITRPNLFNRIMQRLILGFIWGEK